ncbi:PrsW family intramembrane metalloprotease, partial [Patescibacteria group bacterium]|nr:PrsW family intramembrane metalloprotease [Patescibacteria group bacterium]
MPNEQLYPILISFGFASIPAIIWLYILFKKTKSSKKTAILIFLLGCLTAPALLLLQYFWEKFPEFNIAAFLENNIVEQNLKFVALFVLFGALEEIIKHFVVKSVDKRTLLIKSIGDTVRYSLVAALGFAFAENIYYLMMFIQNSSLKELAGIYAFRSTITTCAHMIFSGIFGLYYGFSKYAIYIAKQESTLGQTPGLNLFAKIFKLPKSYAFQKYMVFKGLTIAIILHATYNFILQYNIVWPTIIFAI